MCRFCLSISGVRVAPPAIQMFLLNLFVLSLSPWAHQCFLKNGVWQAYTFYHLTSPSAHCSKGMYLLLSLTLYFVTQNVAAAASAYNLLLVMDTIWRDTLTFLFINTRVVKSHKFSLCCHRQLTVHVTLADGMVQDVRMVCLSSKVCSQRQNATASGIFITLACFSVSMPPSSLPLLNGGNQRGCRILYNTKVLISIFLSAVCVHTICNEPVRFG